MGDAITDYYKNYLNIYQRQNQNTLSANGSLQDSDTARLGIEQNFSLILESLLASANVSDTNSSSTSSDDFFGMDFMSGSQSLTSSSSSGLDMFSLSSASQYYNQMKLYESLNQGSNLVDKNVTIKNGKENIDILVEKVVVNNGQIYLVSNGKQYSINDIVGISQKT